MKTLEFLRQNREKIYEIAEKYGVSNIRVFGSVARGEDKKGSDVDFLIKQNHGVSLFEIADFKYEIEKLLKKKTDLVLEDGVNRHLKKIIFSSALSI
jgi:predicted nucleotidyltransferase